MKDETLERVWKARKSIAKKCGFDSHKLVKYFQKRTKLICVVGTYDLQRQTDIHK